MGLGIFHFQLLHTVLEDIHFIYSEDDLANTVLAKVAQALDAEGGTIFKILPDETIIPLAAYGASLESLKKLKFAKGVGVVGWVAKYVQPLKVDDPRKDARFMESIDATTGFKTRSIIAAPILTKGRAVGIIEFLNRRMGSFAIPDLELISMVGREIGIAFENVKLLQKVEEGRAFQEAILNSLSAGVLVADQDNLLLQLNPRAKEILGLDAEEGASGRPRPVSAVLAKVPQLADVMMKQDAVAMRQEVREIINGREVVIGYSRVPVLGKKGDRLGSALLFQDITSVVAQK